MRIINLEAGMPTAQNAMSVLNNRIYAERASKSRTVKIIHGYGSTGKGGAIRSACLNKLREYKRMGVIKDFCPGDKFGPFSDEGRRMAGICPELRSDSDWGRNNDGITIVLYR